MEIMPLGDCAALVRVAENFEDAPERALQQVLAKAGCSRIVDVEHAIGKGDELFGQIQTIGAEWIVSKRLGRPYRAATSSASSIVSAALFPSCGCCR